MIKHYLIAGTDWIADVPINTEDIEESNWKVEAATRALEAILGKRDDIDLYSYDGNIGWKDKPIGELEETLMSLVKNEIEDGCRIGVMLVVTATDDTEYYFLNSKIVLQNGGFGELVNKFDEKFPDKNFKSP